MRASTATVSKPCRRPRQASLAILMTLLAMAAAAQALAPAQASAVATEGSQWLCTPLEGSTTVGTFPDGSLCEIFNVTGEAPLVIPGLAQTYGPQIPTRDLNQYLGGGRGSGGGSPTKAEIKKSKKPIKPKNCQQLKFAYGTKSPIIVGPGGQPVSEDLLSLKGELEDLREIVSSSQRFAGEARNAQREAKNNEDYEQAHKELQLYLNQIRRLEVEILARTKATKAWEEAYKQLCGKEMQDGFPPPWRPSDHVN